jgi:integrase
MRSNNNHVMSYSIVRLQQATHGYQWAVKIKLSDGQTIIKRLKGKYVTPGVTKIHQESPEYQNQVHADAFNALQVEFNNGPRLPQGCKFRSCREAMEAFERAEDRDGHGNAFKEYFNDKQLTCVPDMANDYVDWLLEKYNRNQQSVSKKLYAASAMFKWLKRKKYWLRENPLHGLLEGIRFAPKKRERSIIEPHELAALWDAMAGDRFKDIRILTHVMFYSGLRQTEAMRLNGKDIDPHRLCLTYQRTKRKNKPPDWRRIAIPAQLVAFLSNEGRLGDGPIVSVGQTGLLKKLKAAKEIANVTDITLKTFRKDFATRARFSGASRDDVNLHQGREESVLEHHYTTDEWFIVNQCRGWVERMFATGESTHLQLVK